MKKIETIADLRDVLGSQILLIKANKLTAKEANAITNAAGKFLSTIKLQLEYMKLQNKKMTKDMAKMLMMGEQE